MLFGSPAFYDPFDYPVFNPSAPRRQRRQMYTPRQYYPSNMMQDFFGSEEYCPCGCGRRVRSGESASAFQSRGPRVQHPRMRRRKFDQAPPFAENNTQDVTRGEVPATNESGAEEVQVPVATFSPKKVISDRKLVETAKFPLQSQPVRGESSKVDISVNESGTSCVEAEKESDDMISQGGENFEADTCGDEAKMEAVSEVAFVAENEEENVNIDFSGMDNGETTSETNTDRTSDSEVDEFKSRQLQTIQKSLQQLNELKSKVDEFHEDKSSKEYLYLEEMLTRCMLSLDNVDSQGIDEIRSARKQAVREIQNELSRLEAIVSDSNSQ